MSDAFYPIATIQRSVVTPFAPVVLDEFESGATNTRRKWAAQYFRRRFELDHQNLTLAEYQLLRSFYSQRSGRYDSFWFRDNAGRGGNAKVRFATDFPQERDPALFNGRVVLEEVSPIRALPEADELVTAAGNTPYFWFDANRVKLFTYLGATVPETTIYDASGNGISPTCAQGTAYVENQVQYSYFALLAQARAQLINTGANFDAYNAFTLFIITKNPSPSGRGVLLSIGTTANQTTIGIEMSSSNYYQPYLGGSQSWTNCKYLNSPTNTWRSVAITWPYNSSTPTMYVNAASLGSDTNTRTTLTKSIGFGATSADTLQIDTGNHYIGHALAFNAELTLAQVKAVHNLLGYQYGLATV